MVWQELKKVNLHLPYGPPIPLLGDDSDRTCPIKDLYTKADGNFIFNNPKLETTHTSINSQLDKRIVAYPLNGFLLRNKRNESLIHTTTRILKIIMLNERSLCFLLKKSTHYMLTLYKMQTDVQLETGD